MKLPSPYLKMRVLGAIDIAEGKTSIQRVKNVANLPFIDEDGNPRKFTWRTIQTWLYRYKNHGVTGITNQSRRDKGKPRKISPEELMEAINSALPHFRDNCFNKMDIYRFCIQKSLLRRQQIAYNTFCRFIKEYDLLDKNAGQNNKKRLAFAMQYANQLWQADTMFGPYVKDNTSHRQSKLIAFIDDASRVVCHGEFFFEENTDSLIKALKAAFYKRGIPEQLYVDNGSIYSCAEITLICARIGCILRHTPVRDGAAKGKIERFFRRVRQQFLSRNLDLSSLQNLNRQFISWLEDEYNSSSHSAIAMKPIDRFGLDLNRVKFLPPSEANDELFFAETTRKVKKDNTFSFKNIRYETPVDLRDKQIQIRFDRSKYDRIVIYYKNQRVAIAKPLDLIANGLLRRKEI
ncbi:MAG: DDE-type integrase/transposase/recombinase [Candidatus Omnitrophica bacterium]|nr:DDE-type integrase/transposase/recombinase [Candidatus Omnitrophota bacterium]